MADRPVADSDAEVAMSLRPSDVTVEDAFAGVLGRWQSEFVAQSILKLLQREDRWAALFTRRDVRDVAATTPTRLAWFYDGFADLLECGLIAPVCDQTYCVTQDFGAVIRAAARRSRGRRLEARQTASLPRGAVVVPNPVRPSDSIRADPCAPVGHRSR